MMWVDVFDLIRLIIGFVFWVWILILVRVELQRVNIITPRVLFWSLSKIIINICIFYLDLDWVVQ